MAKFQPADDFDLEAFIEQLGIDLGDMYRDVEDELIAEIAKRAYEDLDLQARDPGSPFNRAMTVGDRRAQNIARAELAQHRSQAITELRRIAQQRIAEIRAAGQTEEFVRLAAEYGESAAAAQLGVTGRVAPITPGMGGGTVAEVALSLQSRLDVLNQRILRYPQDEYQRIVSIVAPRTLLGATTALQQQKQTVRMFLSKGITGFTDRGGRDWSIGAYAEMAGRTAVNRAFNDAGVARMQASGFQYVTIHGGSDTCPRCAPWIGKVLASGGAPIGTVEMQHATDGSTISVYVAGTLDQARAEGWNHPNCRCRPVAYSPGLQVQQAGFQETYDPSRFEESQKQRALEREVRAAKRDLSTASNDLERKRADRDLRDAQGALREFTAKTGRTRRNYREQLHFQLGGTLNPQASRTGVSTEARVGKITIPTSGSYEPLPHEVDTAQRLAAAGHDVRFLVPSNQPGVKNPDILLGRARWEMKAPTGSGTHTISNQLKRGGKQSTRLILDTTRTPLSDAAIIAEVERRLSRSAHLKRVWIITKTGEIVQLPRNAR